MNRQNYAAIVILFVSISLLSVRLVDASTVRHYNDSDGEKVLICKDESGFLVIREDGGGPAYGYGYDWEYVEENNSLSNHSDETESEGDCGSVYQDD